MIDKNHNKALLQYVYCIKQIFTKKLHVSFVPAHYSAVYINT